MKSKVDKVLDFSHEKEKMILFGEKLVRRICRIFFIGFLEDEIVRQLFWGIIYDEYG